MSTRSIFEKFVITPQRACGLGLLLAASAGCGSTQEPSRGQDQNVNSEEEASDDSEDSVKASSKDAGKAGGGKAADGGKASSKSDSGRSTSSDAGPSTPSDDPSAASASYCEAREVLEQHCTSCHNGKGAGGTPMGLVSYDDLIAAAPSDGDKKVYALVAARIHDADKPMPPKGLVAADKLTALDDWIAAGAPAPSGDCDGASSDAGAGQNGNVIVDGWNPEDCDQIYSIRSHGPGGLDDPYMVPAGQEIHPQIAVDAPWGDEPVQAIGFRPVTDNAKVVHHWILSGGLAFIDGWAPGDYASPPMPPDVGIEMPTGKGSMNLDMHYFNTEGTQAEPDHSGLDICVLKREHFRPKIAAVATSLTTFGQGGVLAPAGAVDQPATGVCKVSGSEPVHILTAGPHAHQYATHMKFTVKKADGTEIVMHDHDFVFGEQGTYALDPEVVVNSGDVIETTCYYTNSSSRNVTFGESTTNEMCFNFALYWPKGGLSCGGGFGGAGGFGGLLGF